jgi:hypothetical protein
MSTKRIMLPTPPACVARADDKHERSCACGPLCHLLLGIYIYTYSRRKLDSSTPARTLYPASAQLMGREESKEQAKTAQREKEAAAHGKKQERKDKVWEKGAKDTTKAVASAASGAEAAERKAAAAAQVCDSRRVPACVARLVCQLTHTLTSSSESPESPRRRLGRRRRRRARGAVATRRRRRRRATR